MATYYVDDGGDNSTGADWASAYTSINALDAAVALASGDIVYFGHDSQCQAVNAGNLTITGPTAGAPVVFISVTQGSNPPAYQQATANQIDTTEGAYSCTFDGSFALYGIKVASGANVVVANDLDEAGFVSGCILAPAANGTVTLGGGSADTKVYKTTIDLTADGTTNRATAPMALGAAKDVLYQGLSFVNAGYRTGTVFSANSGLTLAAIDGCDFSGFNNATLCELFASSQSTKIAVSNCKTAATWALYSGTQPYFNDIKAINVGPSDSPQALAIVRNKNTLTSSSSIYRSGGATIEGANTSWLITTDATCNQDMPLYSEFIYGRITSTGSKTFDVYVTNDTADLTDAEIWLEVEYKSAASSGLWTLATDRAATRTTTPAAQTDDVASTWNGTGPAFTYKQKLSVTAEVATTGLFRARVCVGKASVGAASFLYVDPKVAVS
jgi:hypothetical protein